MHPKNLISANSVYSGKFKAHYVFYILVFSCIDSRTLNKHMFNKHGRQTPLKTGAAALLNRTPSGLSSMIPMLTQGGALGRHPMTVPPSGAGQNPFWNHNRNLFNLKAQEHAQEALRSRFNALSAGQLGAPGAAQLEQIQFLQEQAQLMAAQMANSNNSLGSDVPARENPLSATPNTALLAQIAAQMRAFQAQNNLIGSPGNIIDSTGQSLNTTPEGDEEPELNQIENANNESETVFKQEPKALENKDTCTITEMPASPEEKTGSSTKINENSELTGEMVIEPTSPDPTGSPTGSPTGINKQNHESTRIDLLDDIERKSGASPSPIKVPSENSEEIGASDGENRENSRKRKAEQPLDYSNSINDAIFQQRLQHQGRQLPFPYPMTPFTVSYYFK